MPSGEAMADYVILSGAGLSAESGLGTFRDAGGMWTRYNLEDVATPEGFARDPALVHAFYNARRADCRQAAPNPAHHALARLKAAMGARAMIVTQNIDDLLERAGVADVVHMHGEIVRACCAGCGHRWAAPEAMQPEDTCPACGARATRPDVVWFGEIPYHMEAIDAALARCRQFVAIGTSASVYPAAGFVAEAAAAGAWTVELNLEPSEAAHAFDEARHGPASEIVPAWVEEILAASR